MTFGSLPSTVIPEETQTPITSSTRIFRSLPMSAACFMLATLMACSMVMHHHRAGHQGGQHEAGCAHGQRPEDASARSDRSLRFLRDNGRRQGAKGHPEGDKGREVGREVCLLNPLPRSKP